MLFYRYTQKDNAVYATLLFWPLGSIVELTSPRVNENGQIILLADKTQKSLKYLQTEDYISVELPDRVNVQVEWAYTLKIIGVSN